MFAEKWVKGVTVSTAIDGSIPDTLSGVNRLTQNGKYDWNAVSSPTGTIHIEINNRGVAANHIRLDCDTRHRYWNCKEKLPAYLNGSGRPRSTTRNSEVPAWGCRCKRPGAVAKRGITVESEFGKGTTFSFSIPYEKRPASWLFHHYGNFRVRLFRTGPIPYFFVWK